jgi:antitoxin component YwqK of YwqJK toxin-antitoxin module
MGVEGEPYWTVIATPEPSFFWRSDTGMQNGLVTTYRGDGSLLQEVTYEQGVRHGPYKDYWSNGQLSCEGDYVRGVQQGEWRFYDVHGALREVVRFEGGREVVNWDRLLRED